MARIFPDLSLEFNCWKRGILRVAGLDEAGRGAWAGPVAAAAVILPAEEGILAALKGVRDSKLMTSRQRAHWALEIQKNAAAWALGQASCAEIEQLGILPATRLAMQRALEGLGCAPQHALIDALRLPGVDLPQTAIIRGDQKSLSIAAASVLAKTWRDARMQELDGEYPAYGFGAHKGYGTALHRRVLEACGICPEHRRTYAPVRRRLEDENGAGVFPPA